MPPEWTRGVRVIGHIFAEINANTVFSFLFAPSAPLSHPLTPPHALRAPSRTSPRLLPLSFPFFPLFPRTPLSKRPDTPLWPDPPKSRGGNGGGGGSCHQGGVRATNRYFQGAEFLPTVCLLSPPGSDCSNIFSVTKWRLECMSPSNCSSKQLRLVSLSDCARIGSAPS